jgi:hypothetical protein
MSNVPDMPQMSDNPLDQHESLVRSFAFLVDKTLQHNQTEIAYKLINLTFELADKLYQRKNENLPEKPRVTF